jgi:hypothetical protein
MAKDDAARAMVAWVINVPPADLAVLLMPAFGPGGPTVYYGPGPGEELLAKWLSKVSGVQLTRYEKELHLPLLEAVQLLENAELVVSEFPTQGGRWWRATRLGLAALAHGGVIQRIKDRTDASPSPAVVARLYKQKPGGSGWPASAVDILAAGQRVRGVLKSFADTGKTPRMSETIPTKPEFLDDPIYILGVDLQLPNSASIEGRNTQRVPRAQVPNLAIGLELPCAVSPVDPSNNFVIDWGDIPPPSSNVS